MYDGLAVGDEGSGELEDRCAERDQRSHAALPQHGPRRARKRAIRAESGNDAVELLAADLSSLDQVRWLAERFAAMHPRLDILVNNAAGLFAEREATVDGHEATLATAHLSPALLTHLLLPRLRASVPARIVNVSSGAHRGARIRWDDPQSERGYRALDAYARAKLLNLSWTFELARRLRGTGITVVAAEPASAWTALTESMTPAMLSAPRRLAWPLVPAVLLTFVFGATGLLIGADNPGFTHALLVFVAAGLSIGQGSTAHFTSSTPLVASGLLLALIPVMFSYSGWNAASYIAEEIKNTVEIRDALTGTMRGRISHPLLNSPRGVVPMSVYADESGALVRLSIPGQNVEVMRDDLAAAAPAPGPAVALPRLRHGGHAIRMVPPHRAGGSGSGTSSRHRRPAHRGRPCSACPSRRDRAGAGRPRRRREQRGHGPWCGTSSPWGRGYPTPPSGGPSRSSRR